MNVERNVVYGMYSGLALLMDIYRPDQPNGFGIVHISGSGWSAPLGLDARPLKASGHVEIEALPLVAAGYTVCSINHRATPRFSYPAAVEDAQRAVRFFRQHAGAYGFDHERIGAIGGSSGGHLSSSSACPTAATVPPSLATPQSPPTFAPGSTLTSSDSRTRLWAC